MPRKARSQKTSKNRGNFMNKRTNPAHLLDHITMGKVSGKVEPRSEINGPDRVLRSGYCRAFLLPGRAIPSSTGKVQTVDGEKNANRQCSRRKASRESHQSGAASANQGQRRSR